MRSTYLKSHLERISAGFWRGLAEMSQAGLDFIYPPACLLCGQAMPSASPDRFCAVCAPVLAPVILNGCKRCGSPVGPYLDTALGCIHCRQTPFHFDHLVRLGIYQDLLRRACLTIKKPYREPLTRGLGELLWSRERHRLEGLHIDRVVCVPHHWTRRILPGHNPSETLARLFARRLGAKMESRLVVKTRRTPKQTTLPATRRRKNLRDAFRLRHPKAIEGQNVLLVDDVLTTGTTANRIARLLRKAGAKTITVAVLARAAGEFS